MVRELGKFIVIIGVVATLVGLVMWSGFAPKWLGRLPGDIRIEREHSSFYFPIVTCIVLSIVLEFASLALLNFPALKFSNGWRFERCSHGPVARLILRVVQPCANGPQGRGYSNYPKPTRQTCKGACFAAVAARACNPRRFQAARS